MNGSRIANRDLMPIIGLSLIFGAIGAAAIFGLLALPAPPFSLAAMLP